MDIVFRKSAFQHNISEADILQAFANPYYDGPIEENDALSLTGSNNRFIRLGFDTSGNLLEIMYNEYKDHVCIFHAMRCRSIFFRLLED